jgi:predicted DNA-binding protein
MAKSWTWSELNARYPNLTVRVSPETLERLEKRSAQIHRPRSRVAREFIEIALDALDAGELTL